MKLTLIILLFIMTSATAQFNFGTQHNTDVWRVVNDDVMGGVSNSKVEEKENSILFSGTTSLDNNGGFASIRTTFPKGDLKDCKTMTIRFKSPNTNRSFGLSLKDSQKYYIPYYKFMFQPKSDDWQQLKINLKDFGYYKISEKIGSEMPLNFLKDVFNIALILSDGKEGNFQIEIDYIKFE
jgi:NADH dehydrogenase [ubiquinone] 1 alpha subcomplex assembly factor 1